jgi:hypothetical protein
MNGRADGLTANDYQILDIVTQLYHRNVFSMMKRDHDTIPKLIQALGGLYIDYPALLRLAILERFPHIEEQFGKLSFEPSEPVSVEEFSRITGWEMK